MSATDEQKDRLFWTLCARAMQRAGQGFPSTDEEIEGYEAAYRPAPEEKKRFLEVLQRILSTARKELQEGKDGAGHIGKRAVLERLGELRMEQGLAAAARKSDAEKMSLDLAEDVERMIDESEDSESENTSAPDGGDEQAPPK